MAHDHSNAMTNRRRLAAVLAINACAIATVALLAWRSGSLALLADAAHMVSDSAALLLAMAAMTLAVRPARAGSRRSFGWARAEVLAAGINGLGLLILSVWIVVGALRRLGDPPEVHAGWMLVGAAVGLIANLIGIALLRGRSGLNMRAAYLEVLADALGSVAVLASGAVIALTGWLAADAVASLLIAVVLIPRALLLLRDVMDVLLEAAPREMDVTELRDHILGTPGVADVHDLHAWTITSGLPVMTAHVIVEESITDFAEANEVLARLRECLAEHFDVAHSTFQLESARHCEAERYLHH